MDAMQVCMNWSAIAFDWNQARAFLAAAEEGSYSAAARALGLAQPTLGRQIAALERSLGVALFERIGRGVVLTPAGADLRAHVRAMADAAARVALVAAGQAEDVERGAAQGAFDRATRGLGIVAAVQVGAGAHFDDEALIGHVGHDAGLRSRETEMATLAMTLGGASGRGTSSPPWTTWMRGRP